MAATSFEPVLLRRIGLPRSETIDVYLANGGYQALQKALAEFSPPSSLIDLVKKSRCAGGVARAFRPGSSGASCPRTT